MCNFLSLVETDRHVFYLFTPEQRIAHSKKPLADKRGNAYKMDSHASICAFYGLDEDKVNKYEWNPYTKKIAIDRQVFDVDEKHVQAYLDGIDWHPICGDIEGLRDFCARLREIPFFKRCGSLPDGVKLFKTRVAAWDAARASARASAWDAAWDAARDAAWAAASDAASDAAWYAAWDAELYAMITFLCAGLEINAKHVDYIKKRWAVWEAGYGVLCDVDGVLYCYEKP